MYVRTTLNFDSEFLQLAKELAAREKTSVGTVLSRLARLGYQANAAHSLCTNNSPIRNGAEMLPPRNEPVTISHIQNLLDEEGI